MENEIKVSIIIPVYNAEKYLEELIFSLLNQTLPELEFIFVNDGSTDGSLMLLKKYAQQDDRIILINKTNEGVSVARNAGMREANGEYIGFIDADDFVASNMYQILYDEAQKTSADIISCGYILYQKGYSIPCLNSINAQLCQEEAVQCLLNNEVLGMSICNKLFKKECLNEVFFDSRYRINEDRLFAFSATQNAKKVVVIPDTLYYYRMDMDSVSHARFTQARMDALYVAKEMHLISSERYPQLINESNANIVRSAYAILLIMYKDYAEKDFKQEYRVLIDEIKNAKLLKMYNQLGWSRFIQLLMIKYSEVVYRVIKRWNMKVKEKGHKI